MNSNETFVNRITLNLIRACSSDKSKVELADKILKRTFEIERKTHRPCMNIPLMESEVKVLFPA